jgi:5'(3')-deoxyribonucleotidase
LKVFVDLNDTLDSLTMMFLRELGCHVGDHDYHLFPSHLGYDIVGAYRLLSGNEITDVEFWKLVTRDVWRRIPRSPQFDMVLEFAESFGRENVTLLSATTDCPEQLAAKLEWVQEFCPSWLHKQYLFGPRKWPCADGRSLLIDDSDHQVNAFRQWGGEAILVPRPWNSHAKHNTTTYLANKFKTFLRGV